MSKARHQLRPHLALHALAVLASLGALATLTSCSSKLCCPEASTLKFSLPSRPGTGMVPEVEAATYKVSPRPFNNEEGKRLLKSFNLDSSQGFMTGPNVRQFRSQGLDSAVLSYVEARSEFAYFRNNVPAVKEGGQKDTVIRRQAVALLKQALGDKASQYSFTNVERVRTATAQDTTPRDAYYFGRFVMKSGDRHHLGSSYEARIGFGADGVPMLLTAKDPLRTRTGMVKVPTRTAVWDSLDRWRKSKCHPVRIRYSEHPDLPYISELAVTQILDTYVEAGPERPVSAVAGQATTTVKDLVPRVTVVAQARLRRPIQPDPNQTVVPLPDPFLMYFHFPCTPSAGLCWPDGQKEVLLPGTQGKAIRPNR